MQEKQSTPRDAVQSRIVFYSIVGVILLILISIAVPDLSLIHRYPGAARTVSEINTMDTALRKVQGDAGVLQLGDIFDRDQLHEAIRRRAMQSAISRHEAAIEVYSAACYQLLRQGRNVVASLGNDPDTADLVDIFDRNAIERLHVGYLDIEEDPWDQAYRFYVGPWNQEAGPIPFRTFAIPTGIPGIGKPFDPDDDPHTVSVTVQDGTFTAGFPAPDTKSVYIWSLGRNGFDDQLHQQGDTWQYRADAEGEERGGGDDINNWDPARTWERFYN
jgi:hypothetical protein